MELASSISIIVFEINFSTVVAGMYVRTGRAEAVVMPMKRADFVSVVA
jgi:hypothetical protein